MLFLDRKDTNHNLLSLALYAALLGFVASLLLGTVGGLAWRGADWDVFFRPAALSADPYSVRGNFCPPWAYWMLWPLAILPVNMGQVMLGALSVWMAWYYFKGDLGRLLLLLLSCPMIIMLWFGQVDGLFGLAGLVAPAWLSLGLLACKPQGVALAGLRRLNYRSVAFLLTLLAVSILIHNAWPVRWLVESPTPRRNLATLPWTLPLGALLLYIAHKRGWQEDWLLCLATICITPYYLPHSLVPACAAFLKETEDRRLHVAMVAATWAWFALLV